jgi:hypothetical protein
MKFNQLQLSLEEISHIVSYCNEKIKEAEEKRYMRTLQKKFNFNVNLKFSNKRFPPQQRKLS